MWKKEWTPEEPSILAASKISWGDLFDLGDVDQHVVAHRAEAIGHHHGQEQMVRRGPLELGHGVPADGREGVVEQAPVGVVGIVDPHVGQGHRRDDVGQVDGRAPERLAAHAGGEDHRKEHGDAHDNEAAEHPDLRKGDPGLAEQRRAEKLRIVRHADERPLGHFAHHVINGEKTHKDGPDHGIHKDQRDRDHGRDREDRDHYVSAS